MCFMFLIGSLKEKVRDVEREKELVTFWTRVEYHGQNNLDFQKLKNIKKLVNAGMPVENL